MKKLLYLLPLFFACNDLQTQLPDPEVEDIPFVHAVLYNGARQVQVAVYHSVPAYGSYTDVYWNDPDPITDAEVFLSDGSNELQLAYNALEERYYAFVQSDYLAEGKSYSLRVNAMGRTLTSSCKMPYNPVQQIELQPDSIRMDWGWNELLFRARFKDEAPEGHYYQMDGSYGYQPQFLSSIDFDNGLLLLSDKARDGEWIEETGLTYNEYEQQTIYAELNVASLTRDLYLYNQSMSIYTNGFYEEDNPFIEPSILHHNIKGGLGIFGALSNQKRQFQFN